MPVTYNNRKGITYYLCQGMTENGKVRYYFARQPKDESPDQIPEGYRIRESVNGVVSLVKNRPQLILPNEVASVEAAINIHPKGRDYRVDAQKNQIVVYEQLGPDAETLVALFGEFSPFPPGILKKRAQEGLDRSARFSPILRFILINPEERKFYAERMSYFGRGDNWIDTGESGRAEDLARRLIPKLGTDDFFELF